MRFTRIPLIATLMAVALSLLIVLPALAQNDTRGFRDVAHLSVDVLKGTATTPNTTTDPVVVDGNQAESSFNGNLYVSNNAKAHHRVYVAAAGTGLTASDLKQSAGADGILSDNDDQTNETLDNEWCPVATVTNVTYGKKITVPLDDNPNAAAGGTVPSSDTINAATFAAYFEVIESGNAAVNATCFQSTTDTDAKRGKIPARHGDVLEVEVGGLGGIVRLTVDAKGPVFSEISPDDKVYRGSQSVKIKFLVTDNDSGLAYDGELDYGTGDNDPRPYNTDGDQLRSEPRSVGAGANLGAARDIDVVFNEKDVSAQGTRGWKRRGSVEGVSYAMDMNTTALPGTYAWYLEATDRAGNTDRTDADGGTSGDQDFTVTVDVASPEFKDARTGIAYDADKKTETVDRSSIAVTFKDTDGDFDAINDADFAKFLVEGHEVTAATILMDKPNCGTTDKPVDDKDQSPKDVTGECIRLTPQARLYLQLAADLAPDETPLVSMFGGAVRDLAGNPSNQDEVTPVDRIAPELTVTLTSAVGDRPVVRNGGEVTLNVSTDEELRRLPRVWFVPVMDNGSTDEKKAYKLGSPRLAPRLRAGDAANTWTRAYANTDIGSSDNVYAVVVLVEDDDANIGATTGWTRANKSLPAVNDKADLAKLEAAGLLVEIDTGPRRAEVRARAGDRRGHEEDGERQPVHHHRLRRREGRVRQVHHHGVPRQLRRLARRGADHVHHPGRRGRDGQHGGGDEPEVHAGRAGPGHRRLRVEGDRQGRRGQHRQRVLQVRGRGAQAVRGEPDTGLEPGLRAGHAARLRRQRRDGQHRRGGHRAGVPGRRVADRGERQRHLARHADGDRRRLRLLGPDHRVRVDQDAHPGDGHLLHAADRGRDRGLEPARRRRRGAGQGGQQPEGRQRGRRLLRQHQVEGRLQLQHVQQHVDEVGPEGRHDRRDPERQGLLGVEHGRWQARPVRTKADTRRQGCKVPASAGTTDRQERR